MPPAPGPRALSSLLTLARLSPPPASSLAAVVTGVQIHNWGAKFDDPSPNLEYVAPTRWVPAWPIRAECIASQHLRQPTGCLGQQGHALPPYSWLLPGLHHAPHAALSHRPLPGPPRLPSLPQRVRGGERGEDVPGPQLHAGKRMSGLGSH